MIRAFYSGASGLASQQTAVDILANNISNVNTTGFKAKQGKFDDLVYSSMKSYGAAGQGSLPVGSGSAVVEAVNDMSEGTPQSTGNKSDYSISGDGFFAVRDAAGRTFYTRDGNFHAVAGGGNVFLGDSSGRSVLDQSGNPVRADGEGAALSSPGVFRFADSSALQPVGDNLYSPTAVSGAPTAASAEVKQGFLESSNVDLAEQMTGLLMSQRVFQLNTKVVQTADNLEEMANQLR